jgi:N-acetylmuramoyl-L-alanine amidase
MNPFDLEIGARTIWMEARGEGDTGMLAAAWVLANRYRTGGFGNTVAQVCLKPYQFSCWNTSDPNRTDVAVLDYTDPILLKCRSFLSVAMVGQSHDPTLGATHYVSIAVAPKTAWTRVMTLVATIGNHKFYKE